MGEDRKGGWLFAMYMLLSEDKIPIPDGLVPEKKLYAINRVCKEDKRPIEDGIGPVSNTYLLLLIRTAHYDTCSSIVYFIPSHLRYPEH